MFYGCALHSAGFFMVRGIKWFGWVFIVAAILLTMALSLDSNLIKPATGNWIMGSVFGGLHLAYGSYLYFTEKAKTAA
jgi:hypothetical protein